MLGEDQERNEVWHSITTDVIVHVTGLTPHELPWLRNEWPTLTASPAKQMQMKLGKIKAAQNPHSRHDCHQKQQ